MQKAIMLCSILFLSLISIHAQDEEYEEGGFKKQNLFTGGSLSLSFYSGGSVIGGTPIFGYRIADWIDAGVAFNYIYSGRRDYLQFNDKVRQNVYGPGVFTRLYPINFLFLQAQLEHNYTNLKYIPGNGSPNIKIRESATSFLVGGGYAQGRDKVSNTFYYVAVLFDVMKDEYSPYTEVRYDPNTGQQRLRAVPIIRAGFNIALFGNRY